MKRTIPYGYEFRDGYIGVEKTASSVVRGIYIEYLNGKSFATIAKELTAKGIDYYQGKTEWNKQMVKRVLECPMYCGTEKYVQREVTKRNSRENSSVSTQTSPNSTRSSKWRKPRFAPRWILKADSTDSSNR